ncbi:MAG: TlpA family protein disulfide reductase [Spirochaetes bacterium]|nr:TlpA family protein disulfide reductase [Spirochaetota bacterium]
MKTKIMALIATVALAAFGGLGAAAETNFPKAKDKIRNIYLVDFKLSLEGQYKYVSLKDLLKNNKVVIGSFFYSTCVNCEKEIPAVQKLMETYKDKGVALVLICSEPVKVSDGESWASEGITRVKNIIAKWNIEGTVLDDHNLVAAKNYGIYTGGVLHAPALFIASGDSYVYTHSGWEGDKSIAEIEAVLKQLVK